MTEHDELPAGPVMAQLADIAERRSERREFFRTALGAAAITAVGAAAVTFGNNASAQTADEMTVLNFALQLEYLEAQFYSYAATGSGLPAALLTGTGTQGSVSGGRQVTFTDPLVANYAREIAADEVAHVTYIRSVLGSANAVAQPAVDVSASGAFATVAKAANLPTNFDPYSSDESFLLAAFIFEDVGVTAYKGASSLLINNKAYLEAAAGLLAAESYHASIIRTTLYTKGIATPTLRSNADAISNVRDLLDGTSDDDQGISPATVGGNLVSNIVPTGTDGLAFGRAPASVLNIAYLNSAAVSKGGFFPAGLNGTIVTSTAN